MSDNLIGTEFLPNVYFEYIKVSTVDNPNEQAFDRVAFEAKVCLFDSVEGTWSKNEDFINNLELIVSTIEHREILLQCERGEVPNFMAASRYHFTKNIFEFSSKLVTFENTGKTYRKYYCTFNEYSLTDGPAPASILISDTYQTFGLVAAIGMSKTKLKDNYGLDLLFYRSPTLEEVSVQLEPNAYYRGPTPEQLGNLLSMRNYRIIDNGAGLLSEKTIASDKFIDYFSGPCRLQMIIKEGQLLFDKKAYLFTNAVTGEIWRGPVHFHNSEFMGGSVHSDKPHPLLTAVRINHNKLIDARNDFSNDEFEQYSNTETNQQTFPNYHQEEIVEDKDRNINNTCILNLHSLMMKESKTGQIMAQNAPEILVRISEDTNIKNIEVNRYPISKRTFFSPFGIKKASINFSKPTLIAKSNNNSRKIKEKTLLKVSPRKTVSVNPNKISARSLKKTSDASLITKDLVANSMKIGKIQQIDLSLPKNLRTVNFTDYDISKGKEGNYKYQIKVSIKDEPYLYCKQILKEITMYHTKITNLSKVLVMKNVWKEDHYDSNFLSDFYSQYDMTLDSGPTDFSKLSMTNSYKDSYLYKSFNTLHEVERLIGIKKPRSSSQYKKYLNLFQTSPDKINTLIKYYEKCIYQFKTKYNLIDGQSYEKSSSKKRKDRGMIDVDINLDKEYRKQKISPIGINFIMKDFSPDIPKITPSMFRKRSNMEINKFFNVDISQNSEELKSLPEALRGDFANLQKNKYKNFSPSKIFFGGKELDTTEITPESFDTEFFKDLRIAKTLLENFNNDNAEQEEENAEPEDLIDSRELLGNQTKFNSFILANINDANKIRKVRTSFPLLENNLLKQNKTQLSLDTFEISNPKSAIFKKAKTEISKIPMQIKALSLLKTKITKFDVNSLNYDPLSNPQTQEVFEQNYLNLGTVKVLDGFEKTNGVINLSKPIYKEIDSNKLQEISNKRVLCKIDKTSYAGLTTDTSKFNTFDSVFVMESDKETGLFVGDRETQQTSLSVEEPSANEASEIRDASEIDVLDVSDMADEIEGNITYVDFRDHVILQNERNAGPMSLYSSVEQYEQPYDIPEGGTGTIPIVEIRTDLEPTTSSDGGIFIEEEEGDY